jgi:F0F1-type ATP synthase assembly protein I
VAPTGGLPDEGQEKVDSRFAKIAKYTAIGIQFPSTILGGFVVGYFLDSYFDTAPWFLIVTTFAAFIGAVAQLIQWVRRFGAEK